MFLYDNNNIINNAILLNDCVVIARHVVLNHNLLYTIEMAEDGDGGVRVTKDTFFYICKRVLVYSKTPFRRGSECGFARTE